MIIGYFANERGASSGTHAVTDGVPLCRYRPAKSMQLQFVAAIHCAEYLKCAGCRAKVVGKENTRCP